LPTVGGINSDKFLASRLTVNFSHNLSWYYEVSHLTIRVASVCTFTNLSQGPSIVAVIVW